MKIQLLTATVLVANPLCPVVPVPVAVAAAVPLLLLASANATAAAACYRCLDHVLGLVR